MPKNQNKRKDFIPCNYKKKLNKFGLKGFKFIVLKENKIVTFRKKKRSDMKFAILRNGKQIFRSLERVKFFKKADLSFRKSSMFVYLCL